MSGDYLPSDLKAAWAELVERPSPISLEDLRKEAEKLQKGLGKRSLIGMAAGWTLVVAFSIVFFIFPSLLERMGSALIIAAVFYIFIQLRLRRPQIPDIGQTASIRFYRLELERQRDFHRGSWFWSRLMILAPGPLIFPVGFAKSHPDLANFIWLEFAGTVILAVIAIPLNLRLARRYQRRIDALEASEKGS